MSKNDSVFDLAGKDQKDLCPFINIGIPFPVQNKVIGSPQQQVGVQFMLHPCLKEKCAFWGKENSACSLKLGAEALLRLEDKLAPLAHFFNK